MAGGPPYLWTSDLGLTSSVRGPSVPRPHGLRYLSTYGTESCSDEVSEVPGCTLPGYTPPGTSSVTATALATSLAGSMVTPPRGGVTSLVLISLTTNMFVQSL